MRFKYLFIGSIIMSIFMLSCVSAAEISNDSVQMDDNDTINLEQISADDSTINGIDPAKSDMGLYVDGGVDVSGNGLADSPYKTLKEAVENAHDGDTIFIAPGVYAGCGNVNLAINKNLSFYNSTAGDVIFDGENTNSMFKFTSTSVNIKGLTFKNAVGFGCIPVQKQPDGILFFKNGLKNATINANFIGNKMPNTGIITSTGDIDSVNINCSFFDNTGGMYGGSLIYAWRSAIINSNIDCCAENNLVVFNFIKTNGIYGTDIIVNFKNNKDRYKSGLAIVCDENEKTDSISTIKNIGHFGPTVAAYDGKSTKIKYTRYYFVDTNQLETGSGWSDSPFKTLKEALDVANDDDIIYIAPGTYAGQNNTALDIHKKLSLVRWGEGEVIFDGEGKNHMFVVHANSLNIIDLKFINGRGISTIACGLITFPNGLRNSVIKATFIDNVMPYCGVITAVREINGVDFDCIFIHNEGGIYGGSLIQEWSDSFENVNIICYATNNLYVGTMFMSGGYHNVNITGFFANNTAKSKSEAIVGDSILFHDSTISFTDSVILDNMPSIYHGVGGRFNFTNNWLGNTRNNADKAFKSGMNGWLFLDMDFPTGAVDTFTTQLKLSCYNAKTKTVSSYDEKKLFIPFDGFTLEAINATLDKSSVNFHENFTYSALGTGKGTIIAKHEQFTLKQDFHNLAFNEVYLSANKGNDVRGTGFEDSPYQTLAKAMENIGDGATVYVGAGNYIGEGNVNMNIDKPLNILKTGEGDAVFDAKGAGRIFDVNVNTLNISGLTLKSGNVLDNGGAIRFNKDLVDSFINVSCIDNIAEFSRGGALYFAADIVNSTVEGEFSNDVNSLSYGGAIYVNGNVTNSSIRGSFINNQVSIGSAIFFNGDVVDSTIGGEFINNTAANYGTVFFNGNLVNSIINASFENNTLLSGDGCALYVNGDCLNCTIDGLYDRNKVLEGSVIYFGNDVANLTLSGTFANNTGMSCYLLVFMGLADNITNDANFTNTDERYIFHFMKETSDIAVIKSGLCNNAAVLIKRDVSCNLTSKKCIIQ